MNHELRPVEPGDDGFLRHLYETTRAHELTRLGWAEDQKRAFLDLQYRAQSGGYAESFPAADHQLVLVDGVAAGQTRVDRSGVQIHLVDISLLPERRGGGLGRELIVELQREAAAEGRQLVLHVAAGNPATRLYRRLGFVISDQGSMHHRMTWTPAPDEAAHRAVLT